MPFINVVVAFILKKLFVGMDTGCSCDPYRTKCTTMQQYKKIYSGPDMPIHFKYSDFLNITFLAMLYGIGIPIMFPMACIIIAN